jgi:acyl-CoA synthetase (AMP-forming)/AMP-acid ligase II
VASPGEVGEFVVRGPVVTAAYYNSPEATRFAKIHDPKTGEVLHRMGDVGYIDDRGRLWYCGRKAHRVEAKGGTLFTDAVEPVLNTADRVYRTALVGVSRRGETVPVVCVELVPTVPVDWAVTAASLSAIAGRFDHTRGIRTFLHHPDPFPVDVRHNAKIFREKLAVWADNKLGPLWSGPSA